MIDLYIADGGEPLWVTAAWIALKYVVVCFALRLSPFRALLATAGMVIVSTIVLLAWDIVLPTSWELLFLVVAGVLLETGIEAAFLTWAFRVGWSWRFGLLLLANIVGLLVSVVSAESRDIERAVRAEMVPVGTTRIELMQLAPGPTLERSVEQGRDICPAGTARAVEYHVPTGVIARLLPLQERGTYGSVVIVCLDERDRVVGTQSYTN